MKRKSAIFIGLAPVLLIFMGLVLRPEAASAGALNGLALCAAVIIPSLFPFIVMGNLLSLLQFPRLLGKVLGGFTSKLFGVSGGGFAAFFLGVLGGYPLGAISISEMYKAKTISKPEAQQLLRFCDNSGPAFIISVAGMGVFRSLGVGFFLYAIHVFSALLVGIILRRKLQQFPENTAIFMAVPFSSAFTESVKNAAFTIISVCGFVVFFNVLMSLLNSYGILPALCGELSQRFNLELHFSHSILSGFLELGTGICSMAGLSQNAQNLALCSFIVGFGGLSVQAQAAAVIAEGGLSPGGHLLSKLLHGTLSALITLLAYGIFF